MNINALFKNTVPLSKEKHKDTYLETGLGYDFARELSFVPALVSEFPDLISDYPIAFIEHGEKVGVVALLGLKENENLFVSTDGSWGANYTPAMLRQYPFVAMVGGPENKKPGLLCIAEDHPGVNTSQKGIALFNEDGELSEFASRVQGMVSKITSDGLKSEQMCKRLKELDLLTPIHAVMKSEGGEERRISGIQVVNRKALNDLPAETLKEMQQSGMLELTHLHLLSLKNLRSLATRISGQSNTQTH